MIAEIQNRPSSVGWRAYLEALSSGRAKGIEDVVELEEYALKAAVTAEQQDCQERIQWAIKRLTDIMAMKPTPPILVTRLLGV